MAQPVLSGHNYSFKTEIHATFRSHVLRDIGTGGRRIKATYIAESTAQKTKGYDMYRRFFRWSSDRLNENGVIAFVTNNNFIDAKEADGLRKVIAREFNEVWVVDLKGNARTSGEPRRKEGGNIFHDQIRVGVAIWFCVKKAGTHGCKIMYEAVRDYAKADEKLSFISSRALSDRQFELIKPDSKNNWINLSGNDFETLLPMASKDTKAASTSAKERAIFKLFSNGINTARDGWVTDEAADNLAEKARFFIAHYDKHIQSAKVHDTIIKWSRNLKVKLARGEREPFNKTHIVRYAYRPYFSNFLYQSELMIDELGQLPAMCRAVNSLIAMPAAGDFRCLATDRACDFHFIGDSRVLSLYRYDEASTRQDNITDWALRQFSTHYADEIGKGRAARKISKDAIFHYCYAVLHDPLYREKYAQNLKREFPRIPFYAGFWQWADWGEALMQLHIGYEQVAPFALTRTDTPDEKARAAGLPPKAMLRADPSAGVITLDSETTLRGIPSEAWTYKLGNRSAMEWVLDQYKEKKPKDLTIREKFDTYRFADYKEKVIDLLLRVTTVSVETVRITDAMAKASR